jgi:hypothetical protein
MRIESLGSPESKVLFGGRGRECNRGADVIRRQSRKAPDDLVFSGAFCETCEHGSESDSRSADDSFAAADLRIA